MAEDVEKDAAEEEKDMTGDGEAAGGDGSEGAAVGGGSDPDVDPGEEGGDGAGGGAAEDGPEETQEGAEGADEGAEEDSVVDDDVWAAALKEAGAGETGEDGSGGAGDGAAAGDAGDGGTGATAAGPSGPAATARPADFAELSGSPSGSLANMDMILDIPVTVSVELGRSEMIIKDILQLGQGSVVELEKIAGEPMEILVNGRLVARGEVVMVEEKFGVRLTDIISPTERVKRLG